MADTKPIIVTGFSIMDAGATTNSVAYSKNEKANLKLDNNEKTTVIEDGDTIINMIDGGFEVRTFDGAVASDSHISMGATIPAKAKIQFTGATGAGTYTFDNIRIYVIQKFDGDRSYFLVKGTQTAATSPITVS